MKLERRDQVVVITMQRTENRFNPEHLAELEDAFDQVAAMEGRPAAVLTGEDKFFSNGLDLEWMGSVDPADAKESVERTMRLFARILTSPFGIVAAINGHCFAAGAMMALACDARVMRSDRGFFCLPEVDIYMQFTPGMRSLITAKLDASTAHESMLSGRRYGGEEAASRGIVDAAVAEDEVLPAAIERAKLFAGKDPATVAGIKSGVYGAIVDDLHLPLFGT